MKETIERLRAARKTILEVEDQLAEVDLRYAAKDIQTSIDELEKVQAYAQALAPAFEAIQGAVRKAYETPERKTCTCGRVDVSSAMTGGHVEHVPGRTDPACPFHGGVTDV